MFFRLSKIKNLYKRRKLGYLGLNQQLYDLGLPTDDLFDTVATEVVLSYSTTKYQKTRVYSLPRYI